MKLSTVSWLFPDKKKEKKIHFITWGIKTRLEQRSRKGARKTVSAISKAQQGKPNFPYHQKIDRSNVIQGEF